MRVEGGRDEGGGRRDEGAREEGVRRGVTFLSVSTGYRVQGTGYRGHLSLGAALVTSP